MSTKPEDVKDSLKKTFEKQAPIFVELPKPDPIAFQYAPIIRTAEQIRLDELYERAQNRMKELRRARTRRT